MSSAVPRLKRALRDLLRDLFPHAEVSYGPPPQSLSDQMVYVGRVVADHDRPTAGGQIRSREETANIEVKLSCFVAGDGRSWDDAQQEATEAAYVLLDTLADHFRDRGAATLEGACRDANVSSHELEELIADGPEGFPMGRIGEITATITCRTRI